MNNSIPQYGKMGRLFFFFLMEEKKRGIVLLRRNESGSTVFRRYADGVVDSRRESGMLGR